MKIWKIYKYTQLLSLGTLFENCWLVPFKSLQASNFVVVGFFNKFVWAATLTLVFVVAVISLLIMKQEQAMLRISTDGHDQKIWGGVEIFFARIFLGRKIWQVFCGWLVLSRQIHDFVTTVMASPGNHLVKNHESQSRTIWVPVQKTMSPSWVFCNPTPTLCITVYWNKNSSRNESRINIGWFPRQAPRLLVVWGHAPIGIFLDFNSLISPLSWLSKSFREDVGLFHSPWMKHLSNLFSRFQLFKTYLLWKIWPISIKQRKLVWIGTCYSFYCTA